MLLYPKDVSHQGYLPIWERKTTVPKWGHRFSRTNKSISHLIKCLSETVSVFLSNRDLLTRGWVFALPYLRKTSLSKEGFSMSHFIFFAALFLTKTWMSMVPCCQILSQGTSSPDDFYQGYAPHWFFTEVMLLIDFYRGDAPHWFLPRWCSSLIFYALQRRFLANRICQ
jgi:hypothetical protein